MWRIILDKIATLQEIETHWCLDDLIRANDLLDMRIDLEQDEIKKAKDGIRNCPRASY